MRVCLADIRPDGIARHGLFTESSTTDAGCDWLQRSKRNRFSQFQGMTFGRRESTCRALGELLCVRMSPDSALVMPSIVSGKMTLFRSLTVKSHAVNI